MTPKCLFITPDTMSHLPALHQAVKDCDLPEVRRLLSSPDTDVNATDYVHFTPLMYAAKRHSSSSITHLLLQHGADPDMTNNDDVTAVMLSCQHADRHLAVLQALLTHQTGDLVDLEARNIWGSTAVMYAVMFNSPGCLRLLLDMGARCGGTWSSWRNGREVMEMARVWWQGEILDVLEDWSNKKISELLWIF